MTTNDMLQRRIVSALLTQRPENVAPLTVQLWESIASELIQIIGAEGFTVLYARSLYLTQSTFPWLAAGQGPQAGDAPFSALQISLQAQTFSEAGAASKTLLITFTDILSGLIGEPLTAGIFRAALGDDAAEITSKELAHE